MERNVTFEQAVQSYYSSRPSAALGLDAPRHVPRAVLDWREHHATCAGCRQRIAPNVDLCVRGIQTFHRSCAQRHDAQHRSTRVASLAVAAPIAAPLAILHGSAGRLFDPAGCMIPLEDGGAQHETFQPGSLDDSIARGGQFLSVEHAPVGLRGRFLLLREDACELKFRFELHEGARERGVLAQIRAGAARGCSVKFAADPTAIRYRGSRGTTLAYGRAHLVEVSICVQVGPAWYGTWIAAE
jgi:Caudovirus prohead serine protease